LITPNKFKQLNLQDRIVFTNGCFDILHAGHVHLLECAKSLGQTLVVGLNSDKSVELNKGSYRPIIPQDQRAQVLSGLKSVDYVIIFDEPTPRELILDIKPDVLAKGSDWGTADIVGVDTVREVYRIEFERNISTTKIIDKILGGNNQ
jgi:rfaE bifunctional protein nucleotidyltransferase chain/domain